MIQLVKRGIKMTRIISDSLGEVVRLANGQPIKRCLLINGEWCAWL